MTHFSGPFNIMQDSNADTTTVSFGTSGQVLIGGTLNTSGNSVFHGTLQADGALTGAAASFSGTVSAAGHAFAASAVSLEIPTTAAASSIAGSSLISAASWPRISINGTVYYIPAFTSA